MSDSAASSPTLAGDSVSDPTCGAKVQSNATKTVAQRPSLGDTLGVRRIFETFGMHVGAKETKDTIAFTLHNLTQSH